MSRTPVSRVLLAIALLCPFVGSVALAQHDHDAPEPQSTAPASFNPALPTLYLVGDSTAHDAAGLGWGDHFAHLIETSRVNFVNRSLPGASARSFVEDGHWAALLATLKPGDFVLLQLGYSAADPTSSLPGLGDDTKETTQSGKTVTVHTYGWYLRTMIDDGKAKGAIPMLLTPTVRNVWTTDAKGVSHIERNTALREDTVKVAAQERIYLIDMGWLAANAFDSMGPTETATFFPADTLHTNALGAEINAASAARALGVARSPLADFVVGHD
jgi:hypothetical protein